MQSHASKPPNKSPIQDTILLLDSHGSTLDSIDSVHRYVSSDHPLNVRDDVHKVNVGAADLFIGDKYHNLHEAQTGE